MLLYLTLHSALASPDLYVDGACPGPATIEARHATPGGRVAFVRAAGPGSFTIPAGACAGAPVELAAPTLAAIVTADASGVAPVNPTLGAPACGAWLEAIDLSTCTSSAPTPVLQEPGFDRVIQDSYLGASVRRVSDGWSLAYEVITGWTGLTRLDWSGEVVTSSWYGLAAFRNHLTVPGSDDIVLFGDLGVGARVDPTHNTVWTTGIAGAWTYWTSKADVAPHGSMLTPGIASALFQPDGSVSWTHQPPPDASVRSWTRGMSDWMGAGDLYDISDSDLYVERVGDDGSLLTEDSYDSGALEIGRRVAELPGGVVLALSLAWPTPETYRCQLASLASSGAVNWSIELALPAFAGGFACWDMALGHDGVVVVGGAARTLGDEEVAAVHVDFDGVPHWARTYGPGGAYGGTAGRRGGFALSATTELNQARVIAVDAVGRNGCAASDHAVTASPLPLVWSPRFSTVTGVTPALTPTTTAAMPGYTAVTLDQCL